MDRQAVKHAFWLVVVFGAISLLPVGHERVGMAAREALLFAQDYAREHVLYGLVPALFIAGAIATFISKGAVMRYLGARARRVVAYAVASVSGTVLTICSCTVLPFFAGIYSRGAGLGPATTFLYAGPAINVIAILLTARVLGGHIGVARAVGAIAFSVVIGVLMHLIFRHEEAARADAAMAMPEEPEHRPIGQLLVFFAVMIALLAFVNWGRPISPTGPAAWVFAHKWQLAAGMGGLLGLALALWYRVKPWALAVAAGAATVAGLLIPASPQAGFIVGMAGIIVVGVTGTRETREWMSESWGLTAEILPLLFIGILIAGAMLGRPGHEGLIPAEWVQRVVGGNALRSNGAASLAGGLMYFCTMTEIPIVQGLMGAGMGKGPALAFLLAGPAVSLPNILVLRSIIGTKKTATYLALVVAFSTILGYIYGLIA
ncbi:permease [bacterium]|nr:permease [bacterium]